MAGQKPPPPGKRRGPPPRHGVAILVRLRPEQIAELDAYCEAQPDNPSRPEALRRRAFDK